MKRIAEVERDYGSFIAGLALLVLGIITGIVVTLAYEPVSVVVSCPIGTVQIVRADNVWTCIQDTAAR